MSLFFELEKYIEQSMSDFQIKHFVVNEQLTPYRKVKQILMEMRARTENKVMTELECDEASVKLERAQYELTQITDKFDKKLKEIEIKKYEYTLDRVRSRLKQIDGELTYFDTLLNEIAESTFGGGQKMVEAISDKSFRDTNEEIYWKEKFKRMVLGDFLNFGTISRGTFESLSNLSDEPANAIVSEALNQYLDMSKSIDAHKQQFLLSKD